MGSKTKAPGYGLGHPHMHAIWFLMVAPKDLCVLGGIPSIGVVIITGNFIHLTGASNYPSPCILHVTKPDLGMQDYLRSLYLVLPLPRAASYPRG